MHSAGSINSMNNMNSMNSMNNMNRPRQSLFTKLLCAFKQADDLILQLYHSLTSSFDTIISDVEISPVLKSILHSKQIFFYLLFSTNFLLLNNNTEFPTAENQSIDFLLKKVLFYFLILFTVLVSFFICLLKFRNCKGMYLKRYEELEKYILSHHKELQNNQCTVCHLTKCLRSHHCHLCDKCVTRFELHSDWFHICIGSMNFLPYLIILILLNFYLTISLGNIAFQVFYIGRFSNLYDYSGREFIFHFWMLLLVYLSIKHFKFTKEFIKMGIEKNLTDYEGFNWRRLPYLWKSMRKDYFNPFDKGFKFNLKEIYLCFLNPEISNLDKLNLKLDSNENLNDSSLLINEEKDKILILEDNEQKAEVMSESSQRNLNISDTNNTTIGELNNQIETTNKEISENSKTTNYDKVIQPFITNDGEVIFRQYSGNEFDLLNWNRVRIYSILDLKNSPLREILLKQLSSSSNY